MVLARCWSMVVDGLPGFPCAPEMFVTPYSRRIISPRPAYVSLTDTPLPPTHHPPPIPTGLDEFWILTDMLERMAKDMRTQPTPPSSIPTSRHAGFYDKTRLASRRQMPVTAARQVVFLFVGDVIRKCRLNSHILCHQLHPNSSTFWGKL